MLKIQFGTRNAAFADPFGDGDNDGLTYAGPEVARILRDIADRAEDGATDGKIFDVNGNRIGEWTLTED